jgi:hypothetical protein
VAIDLGVDNFATCVDSTGTAVIVDGKYVKSVTGVYTLFTKSPSAALFKVGSRNYLKNYLNYPARIPA